MHPEPDSQDVVRRCAACAQPNKVSAQCCIACGEALGTVNSSEIILARARDCFERGDAFGARQILEHGIAEARADFVHVKRVLARVA